jgi:hypothetical protein
MEAMFLYMKGVKAISNSTPGGKPFPDLPVVQETQEVKKPNDSKKDKKQPSAKNANGRR